MCLALFGADQQLSCGALNRTHCFDRVEDQVHDDLLQLNAIPLYETFSVGKAGLDRDSIDRNFALEQGNHFGDCTVEIEAIPPWWRFLDLVADPVDDLPSSIGIRNHTGKRLPDFGQVRRLLVQKIQSSARVVARTGDRLRDFVSDRSGELTQSRYATHTCKFGLCCPQGFLCSLGAHDCCHVGVSAAISAEFSPGIEHWLAADSYRS